MSEPSIDIAEQDSNSKRSNCDSDYHRIEQAIHFINNHRDRQPSLAEIAQAVALSEFHFQRLFSTWAGVSPKKFMQFLNKEYALQLLRKDHSILDTSLHVGLSGPGRLHDLIVNWEAATPGEIKSGGQGLEISYGFHDSTFGPVFIATTKKGICKLSFLSGSQQSVLSELQLEWPNANLISAPQVTEPLVNQLFSGGVKQSNPKKGNEELMLFLKGTPFQIKVWEALLKIPFGQLDSYDQIAAAIGKPKASRAVGSAVGANPIAYLIPCHRVIRKVGEIGQYRWGRERKQAIIGWEASKVE